jgi:lipooligosaccharide transport system ATP-binding protein
MNAEAAIRIEHLHKHYGDFEAVHDLSFTVPAGRCTAFLGPNGAGKTTTIKTLYGKALPDRHPETGISVLGFEMPRQELEVKARTGLVPQDNCLDEELNVAQNLAIYARFYGMDKRQARARIGELLEFVELSDKAKNRVKELSGGMQRRLVIARALLNNPRLLILDEPTTGLDPQVRQLIWDKLRSLMRGGVTVLLTTHYMDEAWQIADEIIIMDKGRKVLQGQPRELMAREIEAWVLEILHPAALEGASAAALIDSLAAAGRLRRENSRERVLLYCADQTVLDGLARQLPAGAVLQRPSHLEDLFLKATGRSLNE